MVGSFKRRRKANQSDRYLTKRQAAQHPTANDRAGNPTRKNTQ